jgi:effector-binding domain-containing protein
MATTTDLEFAEVQVAPVLAAQLDFECGTDPASIGAAMRTGFESVMSFIRSHGLEINNQPRAIYTAYGPQGVSVTLALPVSAAPTPGIPEPPIRVDTLPGAHAYRFTHHGPYPDLARTYNGITAFMIDKQLMTSEADWARYMPMWEEYLNDPERTPPSELKTYIYLPVVPSGQSASTPA